MDRGMSDYTRAGASHPSQPANYRTALIGFHTVSTASFL